MDTKGDHYIVEFTGCDSKLLSDLEYVKNSIEQAAIQAKSTIVDSLFHTFGNGGISGAVILAESHIAMHSWPESGYMSLDIYMCGQNAKPAVALWHLKSFFKPTYSKSTMIERGLVKESYLTHKIMEYPVIRIPHGLNFMRGV